MNKNRHYQIVKQRKANRIKVKRKYLKPEQINAYLKRGGKLSTITKGKP